MSELFTKKDFQKDRKNPWIKNPLLWLLVGIVAIIIVLIVVFFDWGNGNAAGGAETQEADTIPAEQSVYQDSVIIDAEEYAVVQEEPVLASEGGNDLSKNETASVSSDEVDLLAISVIRGDYGNNPERRERLKERYQTIQDKVNEMYRNGQVR